MPYPRGGRSRQQLRSQPHCTWHTCSECEESSVAEVQRKVLRTLTKHPIEIESRESGILDFILEVTASSLVSICNWEILVQLKSRIALLVIESHRVTQPKSCVKRNRWIRGQRGDRLLERMARSCNAQPLEKGAANAPALTPTIREPTEPLVDSVAAAPGESATEPGTTSSASPSTAAPAPTRTRLHT